MIVVNLFGGAGVGKSTLAADVFTELKQKNIRSELVGEYAKELVYERAYDVLEDQLYLFAEQAHRLHKMAKYGVQVAVCDSPLLLSIAYNRNQNDDTLTKLIIETHNKYDNMNYFIQRRNSYWAADKRSGSLDKAIAMDNKIANMVKEICGEVKTLEDDDFCWYRFAIEVASKAEYRVKQTDWVTKLLQ